MRINRFLIFNLFFIIIFLPIGVYLAQFSPDYLNYIKVLQYSLNEFNYSKFEPGYWLIVYFNQILFDGSPEGLYFIYEFIIILIWGIAIKKYSFNFFIAFIVFLFVFLPNEVLIQIRQGLAIGIFLLAIDDIIHRRAFNYYLKIFLAIFFHYSAIILLPLYFIDTKKINKLLFVFLPIFGFLLYKFILNISFFYLILDYLPFPLQFKLLEYINVKEKFGSNISINKINLFNLYILSLIFIYYFFLFFNNLKNEYIIIFIKLLGVSLFIWFAFAILPVISFRINNFFYPSIIFLLSFIPFLFKSRLEKILVSLIVLIWSVLMGVNLYIIHNVFH